MKKIVILFVLPLCAFLSGCEKKQPNPTLKLGEALFIENCVECHERTGRGDYLKRIPATLLTRRSEAELVKWIEGKDQHREMPSFTELSDEEKSALAQYLHAQIMK